MRCAMRKKPVRVQFRQVSSITIREPCTSAAATAMKAAEEGSPGTVSSSSSSSSTSDTHTVRPSRSNGTRARQRMRSVWSRLRVPSVTLVRPEARRPAISTHDFTCALATGSS